MKKNPLAVSVEFPEDDSLHKAILKLDFKNVEIKPQHADLTVYVVSDLTCLISLDLFRCRSNKFTVLWIFPGEIKLFPVFDTSETGNFYALFNRIKRFYFDQLAGQIDRKELLNKTLSFDFFAAILDYLPEFINSGESLNTLLIYNTRKLIINRHRFSTNIGNSDLGSFFNSNNSNRLSANILSVFEKLSFHLEKPFGLVDQLKSQKTIFGGWVSSGGLIYRSNQLKVETLLSRTRASGNGSTKEIADAKAFCETLERYSQIFRDREDEYLISSHNELKEKAIHPHQLMLFSSLQYDSNNALSHAGKPLKPFDESESIAWSEVEDNLTGERKWIPTALLYLGIPAEDTTSERFFTWITNGTAAGSSTEMARLNALYEIVERDAFAIWWYNRLPCPGIDIHYFAHLKLVESAIQEHKKAGKNLYVFDCTQDIQIPTIAVISDYPDGTFCVATASNISIEKACDKAFGELNQVYLHHLAKKTKLTHVESDDIAQTISFHLPQKPNWPVENKVLSISEELKMVEGEIRQRGLTIYYKDLTRSDVHLPVVKAIIPGMRDWNIRFAEGRLFSVPQKLYGYLPTEEQFRNFNLL
ncbi:YcaO-like family protein [Arundinibacter roseus]|uniref:YcaO-like family protein n=1 Tax=Arundinibacter roseus TaxID=2070510 RepID=UPI0014053BBF|nr:YcaO-like family protein [Arundinibacter roseus]